MRPLLQRRSQDAGVFGGSSHFEHPKLDHRGLCRGCDGSNLRRVGGRVPEDRDSPGPGQDLSNQLQPFGGQVRQIEDEAGKIAAGPANARNETIGDRVVFEIVADDRDRSRRDDRRSHGLGAARVENVDVEPHELRREARQHVDLGFGPSVLEGEVPALGIAERAQSLSKRGNRRKGQIPRAKVEDTDHRHRL